MKKLFYIVEKQLQDIDGFEEATGWKTITAYVIEKDDLKLFCEIEVANNDATTQAIQDWIEENKSEDSHIYKLVQL